MHFTLDKTEGAARCGKIITRHGAVRTPAFMPVGTAGTVKAIYPEQLRELGTDMVLANCYHLMLRPGAEVIAELGGLHRFMQWDAPILTDSGGFQVMSLARLCTITENGVNFQSHIDGTSYELTPERSIAIQTLLGADICMVLDECTAFPASENTARQSMELSMRWAERSKQAFLTAQDRPERKPEQVAEATKATKATAQDAKATQKPNLSHENQAITTEKNALFGIVQGGIYENLRQESAARLQEIGFDGYALGGLAVGEGQETMLHVLDFTVPHLPPAQPRYLMGVGTPEDIVQAVARGIDMFDCVMPTRAGRHGLAYTWHGRLNLRNACHAQDPRPLDADSPCPATSRYSRAYLHHLLKCNEYLAPMLLTWHNLHFYQEVMERIRAAIRQGRFADFKADFLDRMAAAQSAKE